MLLSFIAATLLITLIPGPSMLLVILRALQQNFSQAVMAILGVVVADAILLCLTMAGVGPLLYSSAVAFELIKWVGVIYLIYLGWQQFRSQEKISFNQTGALRSAFSQAFTTTMLNPKIIGFFIAFFPQFIETQQAIMPQVLILGPLFLAIVALVLLSYAGVAHSIAPLLQSKKFTRWINGSAGISLIGSGLIASTLNYQG